MKKLIENVKKVSNSQIEKIVKNENLSKSQKIKDMFDLGLEIKDIANHLDIRYNFAYNVISNYIIINDIEIIKEDKVNKKSIIINLYNEGKTNKEIAIELKTNYNYVFKIVKEYKDSLLTKTESK